MSCPDTKRVFHAVAFEPTVKRQLADLRAHHAESYEHSLAVARLSIRLGLIAAKDEEQVYTLAAGAVLHDIGKRGIPVRLLDKAGQLTLEEDAQRRTHPSLGVRYINGTRFGYGIDADGVKAIIGGHHEYQSREGRPAYPRATPRTNGWADLVQIVAACDSFRGLVEMRPYKRGLSPVEAIEKLYPQYTGDPYYVDRLAELVLDTNGSIRAHGHPPVGDPRTGYDRQVTRSAWDSPRTRSKI